MKKFRPVRVGGCVHANAERRADGSLVLRSSEALQPYPQRLTDRLEHYAATTPDQVLVARRGPGGEWVPAVMLPPELKQAIADEILDQVEKQG